MTASAPPDPGGADVTVVVVAYEAGTRIRACLEGLRAQRLDGTRLDVVVVDNASTDGTADLVAAHHPEVRLVRSTTNAGFAGGNNRALRDVRSPWVILLNDDAVPEPTFVVDLLRAAQAAPPRVAAIAATVVLAQRFSHARDDDADVVTGPAGRYRTDSTGDIVLVNSTGSLVRRDGYGLDRGWLDEWGRVEYAEEVFSFSGAAVALRLEALADVGGFDESFFMYYEDTDLAWRLRLAGWSVRYCAGAVVRHEHAASSREGSAFFRFHDQRNRLLMLVKDATWRLATRAVLRSLLTLASVALRRREPWPSVCLRLRVLASFVRHLPGALRARRAIGRTARVSRRSVEAGLADVIASAGPLRA